jgi:nucleoid-associated protein YgaU
MKIDCPVCNRKNIVSDNCPGCDADLTSLKYINNLPALFINKSKGLLFQGLPEQSIEALLVAAALNSSDTEPYLTIGDMYAERKLFATAILYYQKALALEPSNLKAIDGIKKSSAEIENIEKKQNKVERKLKILPKLLYSLPLATLIITIFLYTPVKNLFNKYIYSYNISASADELKYKLTKYPVFLDSHINIAGSGSTITLNGEVPTLIHKYLANEIINGLINSQQIKIQNNLMVKRSHTLSLLASLFYNNSNQWQNIYNINKNILNSPDELIRGRIISIPINY